jgi:serine/threonine protein kinase
MEDRYEIRKKIGQGGFGSVYLANDLRMNREVAIKRIGHAPHDPALQEESTKQLLKEIGTLSSIQHPHIVTIYDVGADEDGPFVVMELITGKTLDELIEKAPLTWPDFREFALQTQEALIAAQALNLIHSDIKPANLMLTWLPSGKLQIKIVDFGLARIAASQSCEELQNLDAVYGSIFFMAPEQFERVPSDSRTDIYSMACVYYQALTGTYPFQGETVYEVMTAHLNHQVIPIQDLRAGIPMWVCDWIMWQLNRLPQDRPESSREALQLFLQNDINPQPAMSRGPAATRPTAIPRARLAGTAAPLGMPTAATLKITAPQAFQPPEGSKPSVHSASHTQPQSLPAVEIAARPSTATPTERKPQSVPRAEISARPNTAKPRTAASEQDYPVANQPPKKSISGRMIAISGAFVILIGVLSVLLFHRVQERRLSGRYANLLVEATEGSTEIPMSLAELDRYLTDSTNANTDEQKNAFLILLKVAKPNDGTNFDKRIVEFAVQTVELLPEDRQVFMQQVVAHRADATSAAMLIDFARSTNDKRSAEAAFEVVRKVAGDEHFPSILAVISSHPNLKLRTFAESIAQEILTTSKAKPALLSQLTKAIGETTDKKPLDVLRRLEKSLN